MTTPTREQAWPLFDEWYSNHGWKYVSSREGAFITWKAARYDLEATIAEQAAEIERLHKYVDTALTLNEPAYLELKQQLADKDEEIDRITHARDVLHESYIRNIDEIDAANQRLVSEESANCLNNSVIQGLREQLEDKKEQIDQLNARSKHVAGQFFENDKEVIRLMLENEQLRQKIAEQETDIKTLEDEVGYQSQWKSEFRSQLEYSKQQLTEQQAYAEQLRGCLDMWLLATVNDRTEYAGARAITRKELSIPHDTTALQEYGAKLVERIAANCELSTKLYLRAIADKIRKGEF